MRIAILATTAAALSVATPSQATTYQVDLSTIQSNDTLIGPCWCGQGPLYPVMDFQSGDIVDFGSVRLSSFYDGHSAGHVQPRWNPITRQFEIPLAPFNFNPSASVSYAPLIRPQARGGFSLNPMSYTMQLQFAIPDGASSIQIGWAGYGIYTPPVIAESVPEPSTWAMLLIGFAGIGFASYRRMLLIGTPPVPGSSSWCPR